MTFHQSTPSPRPTWSLPLLLWIVLSDPLAADQPRATPDRVELLSVAGAVAKALDLNLPLLAQRYSVSQVRADLIGARLRPNPVLSLVADHLDMLGTHFDADNGAGPPEYTAHVDVTIERGGKRDRRIDVARGGIVTAEKQLERSVQSLALDVAQACVDLQQAHEELSLAEEDLATMTRIGASTGPGGPVAQGSADALRATMAKARFANAVDNVRARVTLARSRVQGLMGRAPSEPLVDVREPPRSAPSLPPLESLVARALDQRPDLAAVRSDFERSKANERLQSAKGQVDLLVGAEARRQDGIAGRGDSVGFSLSVPLPVNDRNQDGIERSRQESGQLAVKVRDLEQTVKSEVFEAWVEGEAARTVLERIETELLPAAQQFEKTTLESFLAGHASVAEAIDVAWGMHEAMLSYAEARSRYARALYRLDCATGKVCGSDPASPVARPFLATAAPVPPAVRPAAPGTREGWSAESSGSEVLLLRAVGRAEKARRSGAERRETRERSEKSVTRRVERPLSSSTVRGRQRPPGTVNRRPSDGP